MDVRREMMKPGQEEALLATVAAMNTKELSDVDEGGVTFLHSIADKGASITVAEAFLKRLREELPKEKAQAVVDAKDNQERSALSIAVASGQEALALLLIEEMSPEAAGGVDHKGWSSLAYACNFSLEEVALRLIDKLPKSELFRRHSTVPPRRYGCGFARGNAASNGDALCGGTPMHFAVRTNQLSVVEALLGIYEAADMEIPDGTDRPVEVLAAVRGHYALARLLWERAPLSNEYWKTYTDLPYGGGEASHLRLFFPSLGKKFGIEFLERLIVTADEPLLKEILYCGVLARSPEIIMDTVSRMSQKAIDEKLPGGDTLVSLCQKTKGAEDFVHLLQKCGPKSALC